MADQDNPHIAIPRLQPRPAWSLVWLVPLLTLLIGAALVYKTLSERGPMIDIRFASAAGIEAGVTRIRYKDVEIGVVESVQLGEDNDHVQLTAQMTRAAEPLLRQDTRFWVVRPRLTLREVSGLGTLLSGAYIELDPGKGKPAERFVGLETPPVLTTADQGKTLLLETPRLNSIGIGSPIYYQGIVAGEVLGYELAGDQRQVLVHAFIKAPYDALLRDNTRFWNVSGLDVSVDADGIKVRTESLESLMFGGIAFETPARLSQTTTLTRRQFTLWPSREQIEQSRYTDKSPFVLFFQGSVRGLRVGAPVEFQGMRVGAVRDIRLEYHSDREDFRIPVLVELEPERVAWIGATPQPQEELVQALVERGLRARLQSGNLLTGQVFVDLVMRPDSELHLLESDMEIAQLPTIPGDLDELTTAVRGFVRKLNQVEIDRIAQELQGTLAGSNRLLNHPELDSAVTDLSTSLASLKTLLGDLEKRSGPISKNVESALGAVAPALEKAGRTMSSLDSALQPDSQLHFRVIRVADELIETARSIRAFVNLLERNPESVIFGKQANE